ncbi:MAG: hypothetical protein AB1635_20000 [Acidobacteriota bacterium]
MANPVVLTTVAASGTDARERLRAAHQVRLVEPAQEGTSVEHLPDGVYGFTYSPALAAPLFRQFRYQSFEMHRASGDAFIVGFVSPVDANRLREATDVIDLTLQHDVSGDATVLVGLPYSRIVQHRQYSIRNAPGLSVRIRPA